MRRLLKRAIYRHRASVAVAFFAGLLVAGGFVAYQQQKNNYTSGSGWKTYTTTNAIFSHPSSWKIYNCSYDKPFIELPGTIKGTYKDSTNYRLSVRAMKPEECLVGRQVEIGWLTRAQPRNGQACEQKMPGERLRNGLYLHAVNHLSSSDYIYRVLVLQGICDSEGSVTVVGFYFAAPHIAEGQEEAGQTEPGVPKATFLASPQYRDIKRFAESIQPVK